MQRYCRSCFSVLAFDPFVPCGFGNPLQLLFGAKTERRRSRFLRGSRGTVTLLPRRRRRQHRSRRFKRSGVQTTRSTTTLACSWRRSCFLTDGSTFTWEYFQPVQLVQQVLDKCTLLGSTRRSCAITHPRQINHGASCLAATSTRQAAKWCPSTVGKHGSRLQFCRVRARHPRVRRQLVCTRDRAGSGVQEVAWRMVGGDDEGNLAAIAEVSHALESWCRSRSTIGLAKQPVTP